VRRVAVSIAVRADRPPTPAVREDDNENNPNKDDNDVNKDDNES
jgi:hypothetical protein